MLPPIGAMKGQGGVAYIAPAGTGKRMVEALKKLPVRAAQTKALASGRMRRTVEATSVERPVHLAQQAVAVEIERVADLLDVEAPEPVTRDVRNPAAGHEMGAPFLIAERPSRSKLGLVLVKLPRMRSSPDQKRRR